MEHQVRKFRFIGCEIIRREACYLAATGPHYVSLEFLAKGLHDLETPDMVAKVQEAIDATDSEAGCEAIILGYARCNNGLVGVTARDLPLVLPKAHDCITLFLGSRDAYRNQFDRCPGTYYMTTGWSEVGGDGDLARPAYGQTGVMGNLGLSEPYEQMVAKYGKENADFIRQTVGDWTGNYSRMMYLQMGICDETPYIEKARRLASRRGWRFELRKGDWTLLRKLFAGQWDDDFLIVEPGQTVTARNDDDILSAEG